MSVVLEGRWSKRGLKKCSKCGTYNGNRGIRCKNNLCGQILSSANTRKASIPNDYFMAVQIKNAHQEKSLKLYSVRKVNGNKVIRGFVEIREEGTNEQLLQHKTGVCYVDCHPHTDPEGTCQHVRVASETTEVAEGLEIRREFLELLNITTGVRNVIWKQQLACSAESPLVQKVAADTFVVRCDDEFHQPVPYCHVQLKHPSRIIYDCQILDAYEGASSCYHTFIVAAAILSDPKYRPVFESIVKHLMLPSLEKNTDSSVENVSSLNNMMLLQNDPAYDGSLQSEVTDQFLVTTIQDQPTITSSDVQFIDCNLNFEKDLASADFADCNVHNNASTSPVIELINSTENSTSAHETFTANYYDNLQLMDCQIELMDQFNLTDRIDFCPSDIELSDDNLIFPADEELGLAVQAEDNPSESGSTKVPSTEKPKLVEVTTKKAALRQSSKIAKEKMKRGSYNVRRLMKVLESNGVVFNRLKRSEAVVMAAAGGCESPVSMGSLPSFEAAPCNLSFTGWLESVIEQLNKLIDYNGNGKPDTQTFSIHESFFQCLRSRFSVGHRSRMPDYSFGFGIGPKKGLTCYVYKFSCYKSIRNVMKTDKIALKFEKSFCRNSENIYEELDLSDVPSNHAQSVKGKRVVIRAFQFKTYIKMGTYKSDANEKVHFFLIEWIPGVLPKCGFGEMRITFEYGHKENNAYVEPPVGPKRIVENAEGISDLNKSQS